MTENHSIFLEGGGGGWDAIYGNERGIDAG